MSSEKFERRGKQKCDSKNPQSSQHLHRASAANEKQNSIDDERDDRDIQKVNQPNAGLEIREQITH